MTYFTLNDEISSHGDSDDINVYYLCLIWEQTGSISNDSDRKKSDNLKKGQICSLPVGVFAKKGPVEIGIIKSLFVA